jgi:hypothetical protein
MRCSATACCATMEERGVEWSVPLESFGWVGELASAAIGFVRRSGRPRRLRSPRRSSETAPIRAGGVALASAPAYSLAVCGRARHAVRQSTGLRSTGASPEPHTACALARRTHSEVEGNGRTQIRRRGGPEDLRDSGPRTGAAPRTPRRDRTHAGRRPEHRHRGGCGSRLPSRARPRRWMPASPGRRGILSGCRSRLGAWFPSRALSPTRSGSASSRSCATPSGRRKAVGTGRPA